MKIRCKMCGGLIESDETRVCECPSCGGKILLPDTSEVALLLNKGNKAYLNKQFSEAAKHYRNIIADGNHLPEAYWCLALCNYKVSFEMDTKDGIAKPTISDMSPVLFTKDSNYLNAIKYSEGEDKNYYEDLAERIVTVQKRYFNIIEKLNSFDVFISFKATDEDGNKTQSNTDARKLFYILEKKGIKTFYSEITLQDVVGEDYEPYIYNALKTAKLMVLVADDLDQIESTWVKNEWMRFIKMMNEEGSSGGRKFLSIFRDVNPGDFPDEFSNLQGIDLKQDPDFSITTDAILDILGKKTIDVEMNTSVTSPSAENKANKIKALLEIGNYDEAKKQADSLVEEFVDFGEGYFLRLLAKRKVKKAEELYNLDPAYTCEETDFKNALKYGDNELSEVLSRIEYYSKNNYYFNKAISRFDKIDRTLRNESREKKEIDACLELFKQCDIEYKSVKGKIMDLEHLKEVLEKRPEYTREFYKKIGDKKTYLPKAGRESSPSTYEVYEASLKKKRKRKKDDDSALLPLNFAFFYLYLIIIIIFGGVTLLMTKKITEFSHMCGFVNILCYGFVGFMSLLDLNIPMILISALGIAAIPYEFAHQDKMFCLYATIILFVVLFINGILEKKIDEKKKKIEIYYRNVHSLEESIHDKLKKEWGDKINPKELDYFTYTEEPPKPKK